MTPDAPTPRDMLRADFARLRDYTLNMLDDVQLRNMALKKEEPQIYTEKHLARLVDAHATLTALLFKTVYAAQTDETAATPPMQFTPQDLAILAEFMKREQIFPIAAVS